MYGYFSNLDLSSDSLVTGWSAYTMHSNNKPIFAGVPAYGFLKNSKFSWDFNLQSTKNHLFKLAKLEIENQFWKCIKTNNSSDLFFVKNSSQLKNLFGTLWTNFWFQADLFCQYVSSYNAINSYEDTLLIMKKGLFQCFGEDYDFVLNLFEKNGMFPGKRIVLLDSREYYDDLAHSISKKYILEYSASIYHWFKKWKNSVESKNSLIIGHFDEFNDMSLINSPCSNGNVPFMSHYWNSLSFSEYEDCIHNNELMDELLRFSSFRKMTKF